MNKYGAVVERQLWPAHIAHWLSSEKMATYRLSHTLLEGPFTSRSSKGSLPFISVVTCRKEINSLRPQWGQSVCGQFDVSLWSAWGQSVVSLRLIYGQLAVNLRSVCRQVWSVFGQFEVSLGSACGQSAVSLPSVFGQSTVSLRSVWGQLAVNLRSVCGPRLQPEATE
jgi:hypothetical protein